VAATPAPELSRPLAFFGLVLHFLQLLGFSLHTLRYHSGPAAWMQESSPWPT